jgi:hypothetical protein
VAVVTTWLTGKRRRVETVIGQLTGRYYLKRVWARDGWHLWPRWQRKLLNHTLAVYLGQRARPRILPVRRPHHQLNPHTG